MNNISEEIRLFLSCKSQHAMGILLGLSAAQFRYIVSHRNLDCFYRQFNISKKNGNFRKIVSPSIKIKVIQNNLVRFLQQIYNPPLFVNGFIKGKSILSNAIPHVKQKIILKIDLKNFFENINFFQIRDIFLSNPFSFNTQIATFITRICCFSGHLAQGSPVSPIISNIVCSRLDKQLYDFTSRNDCILTRYADDITISSSASKFCNNIIICENPIIISNQLKQIIESNRFKINYEKLCIKKQHTPMFVTGVKINNKPNLSRSKYRQIRSMIYSYLKYGDNKCLYDYSKVTNKFPKCTFYDIIKSKISFFEMIRGNKDNLSIKLKRQLNDIKIIFDSRILLYLYSLNYSYTTKLGYKYIFINVFNCDNTYIGSIWKIRSDKINDNYLRNGNINIICTNIKNLQFNKIRYIDKHFDNYNKIS